MSKKKEDNIKSLIRKAEGGDPEACYQLYLYYQDLDAEDTTPDSRTAEWCRKAAELGNVDAMLEMGDIYYLGDFVEGDGNLEKALYWYTKAVEAGCAPALVDIAEVYRSTYMEDPKEAFKFYKMAADEGVPVAYMHLYECYSRGYGVETSRQKAFKCRQEAVRLGVDLDNWVSWEEEELFDPIPDGDADPFRSSLFPTGLEPEDDWDDGDDWDEEDGNDDFTMGGLMGETLLWSLREEKVWARDADYRKILKEESAAKENLLSIAGNSLLMLGSHNEGEGLYDLSDRQIIRKARSGDVVALAYAGAQILTGMMKGSESEAEKFLREASSKGHAFSAYMIGNLLLERGEMKEAAIHLENSVNAGLFSAAADLAAMYFCGNGVPKDTGKGYRILEKGVKGKDPRSMLSMGILHMQGVGVKRDLKKAAGFVEMATDLGEPTATRVMSDFCLCGIGVPKNEKKGLLLLKRAAHMGCMEAMCTLGTYFLNGTYVEQNPQMGQMLLEKASGQGGDYPKYTQACLMIESGSDVKKGFAMLRECCDDYFLPAIYTAGKIFLEGKLAGRDLDKAEKLLKASFRTYRMASEILLGSAYIGGLYGQGKVKEGVSMVSEAAETGLPCAMALLSVCYGNGVGVEKDAAKAGRWKSALRKTGQTMEDVLVKTPEGFYAPDTTEFFHL